MCFVAIPYNRHLLQLAEPYQTTRVTDHSAPVTSASSHDLPLDPYSKLLDETIRRQSSLDDVREDPLLSSNLSPTGDAGDMSHDHPAGGRHVSVDASRDGVSREVDLDNMTARSPSLKSLEDDEDEAARTVEDIYDEAPHPPSPTLPAGREHTTVIPNHNEYGLAEEVTKEAVDQVTTPAAHPSLYQVDSDHMVQPQPWQSPMLDDQHPPKDDSIPNFNTNEAEHSEGSLLSLVENQMSSYFPATGVEPGSDSSTLGQVRQSLATALKQDLGSLYRVFAGQEETAVNKVNTLYEDNNNNMRAKPDERE